MATPREEWTTKTIEILAGHSGNIKEIECIYNKQASAKGIAWNDPAVLIPSMLVQTAALVTQSYILLDIADSLAWIAGKDKKPNSKAGNG